MNDVERTIKFWAVGLAIGIAFAFSVIGVFHVQQYWLAALIGGMFGCAFGVAGAIVALATEE